MPVRRIKMQRDEAAALLKQGRYGVLSTVSADGEPYGVPVNYFYRENENAIYCHCAQTGRKLDNIRQNSRVSFAVVGSERIVEELFITNYRSVIAQGEASIVADPKEKERLLDLLCAALAPAAVDRRREVIAKHMDAVCVLRISVETLSGKQNADD